MGIGHDSAEIAIRLLLADPFEERLKLRRFAQQFDSIVKPRQFRIRPRRVQLLVAGLAERRAMLSFAAFLPGGQMMLRNQRPRDMALAQRTGGLLIVRWMHAADYMPWQSLRCW